MPWMPWTRGGWELVHKKLVSCQAEIHGGISCHLPCPGLMYHVSSFAWCNWCNDIFNELHKYHEVPWLVGGLEPWNFMTFHILGMSSSQLIFIFFRGVGQPPTRYVPTRTSPGESSGVIPKWGDLTGDPLLRPSFTVVTCFWDGGRSGRSFFFGQTLEISARKMSMSSIQIDSDRPSQEITARCYKMLQNPHELLKF